MVGDRMTFSQELQKLLIEELKALESLRDLAFEKTDIITSNNIEELGKIIGVEEDLINKIGLLERARIDLFDTWGVAVDLPISLVIERVPEGKEALLDISNNMGQVIQELNLRNTLNKDLIQENLDWIDFNMNLIRSIETPTSYGRDKRGSQDEGRNNIFDRKV